MSDSSSIYNQLAKEYVSYNANRNEMVDDINKFSILLPKNAKMVDLGCGVGFDARDLRAKRPDLQITGVDSSDAMLEEFKRIAKGIPFIKSDMLMADFEYLDAVWLNAALLHVRKNNALSFLKKIHSWLKNGGYFYIKTKRGKGEKEIPATKYGRSDLLRFFAFYTKEELAKLLTDAGFNIVEINDIDQTENWVVAIAKKVN